MKETTQISENREYFKRALAEALEMKMHTYDKAETEIFRISYCRNVSHKNEKFRLKNKSRFLQIILKRERAKAKLAQTET